jgi:RNA polymerase sigma-70 factor (ECF subfamily)
MHSTPVSLLVRLTRPAGPAAAAADWDRFVELFTPLLYSWAARLGLPAQDAADLVQDVFLTLVRELPTFRYDPGRSFRAWLRTLLLNRWRDRARRAPPPLPVDPAALDERPGTDPAAGVEDAEYRRYLARQALRLMQRDFQPVTWRACWETKVAGRPAAEVAAELGLTVAAVHAATYRVLRRLRAELDGFLG